MSAEAERWLQRRVRVWPAFDRARRTMPLGEGVVVGYSDAPSIVVRAADGSQSTWLVSLPIDVLEERAEVPPAMPLYEEEFRAEMLIPGHEHWIAQSEWLPDGNSAWNHLGLLEERPGYRFRVMRRRVSMAVEVPAP